MTADADGRVKAEDDRDRYALQARYLELTQHVLPALAAERKWPVRFDHCFMRIVLDHTVGGCWYDHLDRRLRAYKQLNQQQLERAVALAERLVDEGEAALVPMNRQSLRWRGKRP